MPEITPYNLSFPGGYHVGTLGVNLEESQLGIPSDTLFAAMVDVWSRTNDDLETLLAPFVQEVRDPPFLISSAFPYAGQVRFYPTPVDLTVLFSSSQAQAVLDEYGKKLKRVRYISEGLLRKILSGDKLDNYLFPIDEDIEPESGLLLQDGAVWMTGEEVEKLPDHLKRVKGKRRRRRALRYINIWARQNVPRNTIDRIRATSDVFQAGRILFAPQCGLWIGIEFRSQQQNSLEVNYSEALKQALGWLQDDGYGGERTTGYGGFCYSEERKFILPDPRPGKTALLLSRYLPHQSELPTALNNGRTAYHLVPIGGWLRTFSGAAQRRKRIFMIEAGSFVNPPAYPAGTMVDVKPTYQNPSGDVPHPVYRAGYALAVGLPDHMQEEA